MSQINPETERELEHLLDTIRSDAERNLVSDRIKGLSGLSWSLSGWLRLIAIAVELRERTSQSPRDDEEVRVKRELLDLMARTFIDLATEAVFFAVLAKRARRRVKVRRRNRIGRTP